MPLARAWERVAPRGESRGEGEGRRSEARASERPLTPTLSPLRGGEDWIALGGRRLLDRHGLDRHRIEGEAAVGLDVEMRHDL